MSSRPILERSGLPYFAFGSNMLKRRLAARCPSAEERGVGALVGYELLFDKVGWSDGTGKCRVRPGHPTDVVWGVLYDISAEEFENLDKAEGLGRGYEVGRVDVVTAEGMEEAFTYLAQSDFVDASLRPFDWYVQLVVAGAKEHGLPGEYVRSLSEVSAVADTDGRRSGEANELLRQRTRDV